MLSIGGVLTAEMFNSALESMAKAITHESNPHLGGALDIGSAAVLIAAITAAVVGSIVFLNRLGEILGWWAGSGEGRRPRCDPARQTRPVPARRLPAPPRSDTGGYT